MKGALPTSVYYASKWGVRAAFTVMFLLRVRGLRKVPRTGPVIVAANHASLLDPLLVGCTCPRRSGFLARQNLERIWGVGWWMRQVGTLFIDRSAPSTAVLQKLVDVLREGKAVIVFPEGTRTDTGELQPFKRGILLLAKRTGAPVVPVGIRGSFEALPRGRGLPRLLRPISVSYGEPMSADRALAEGGLDELRSAIAALSGQRIAPEAGTPDRASDPDALRVPCAAQERSASVESGLRGEVPVDSRSSRSTAPSPRNPHRG